MNKINVRKLKHMLKKYKKAAIFVAMLAVVGIGIGVAHVLAVSVAIKCANLELSKNGFYSIALRYAVMLQRTSSHGTPTDQLLYLLFPIHHLT